MITLDNITTGYSTKVPILEGISLHLMLDSHMVSWARTVREKQHFCECWPDSSELQVV